MAMSLWFQATRGWTDDAAQTRLKAGEWAEKAVVFEDADGQAHTVLGNVRLLQQRYEEALQIGRAAVAVRPGCTNANGFLANVLLHCGEPEQAIAYAKKAIRISPVYPPWFLEILAASYREAGQLSRSHPLWPKPRCSQDIAFVFPLLSLGARSAESLRGHESRRAP